MNSANNLNQAQQTKILKDLTKDQIKEIDSLNIKGLSKIEIYRSVKSIQGFTMKQAKEAFIAVKSI
jgi:hypothetical protein